MFKVFALYMPTVGQKIVPKIKNYIISISIIREGREWWRWNLSHKVSADRKQSK